MEPDLLAQAIARAKAGDTAEARTLLLQILKADPTQETAWMWLVKVLPNNAQRIAALEQWLRFVPDSVTARQGLEHLRAQGQPPAGGDAPNTPPPAAVRSVPSNPVQAPPDPAASIGSPPPVYQAPQPPRTPSDSAQKQTQPPIHSQVRPRSPLVLGKAEPEQSSQVRPGGLADFLRRGGLDEPAPSEPEDDLGIIVPHDDEINPAAVSRVFTTDPDDLEGDPKAGQKQKVQPRQEPSKGTDEEDIALDQLRGKAKKRASSRRSNKTRAVVRGFLLVFYLAAFLVAGYYLWQSYGQDIRGFINAQLLPTVPPATATPGMTALLEAPATQTASPLEESSPTPAETAPAPTATPQPLFGERPDSSQGSVIYNAVGNDGKVSVFSVPAAGGQAESLRTEDAGNDFDPALSADGRLIFSRDGANLYLVNSNGQVIRLTSNGAGNREPAWSPDGKKIAFVSERDGNPEIYLMDPDGSNTVRLTRAPGIDSSPAWSPDGKRLAFISDRDGFLEVYTMNLDGGETTRITFDMAECSRPAWSPDGNWLAYSSTREGDAEIYRAAVDGFQSFRVTFSPGADLAPTWSPDSLWIAFLSDRQAAGKLNLYATTFDGSKVFAFFPAAPEGLQAAAWAPQKPSQP